MKHRIPRVVMALALAGLLVTQSNVGAPAARAFGYSRLTKIQKRLLSGTADFELNPRTLGGTVGAAGANQVQTEASNLGDLRNYFPGNSGDCPIRLGDNVKVNQNCLNLSDPDLQGRGQANNETAIAFDPFHPDHMVASDNDYRRGDGNCGVAYSLDRGQTWKDSTLPTSFTRGRPTFGSDRQYWGGGGDTSVAWDTRGNAYIACQLFNRGRPTSSNPDQSSAFFVYRSTQNGGASWNFTGRVVTETNDISGTGQILQDKEYLTVDNHVGSRFRDRIYVTWTLFAPTGSGYIWSAYSSDYGEHFSPAHLVSGDSPLCVQTFGAGTEHGNCNENQDSQPFVGPDGTLYVVFNNYNNAIGHPAGDDDNGGPGADAAAPNPNDNHNQVLLAKSTDGGETFSAPVKVADFYDLPDCQTYQGKDAGRGCVPEKSATNNSANSFFRANNYPVGAVNPKNPKQVVVTFGSYINPYSNEANGCAPAGFSATTGINLYTGVKTPGACNNDILISTSNDGGASFTGTKTDPRKLTSATAATAQRTTDQFWQWAAFGDDGKLAVSYYDRQYGDDETTGFSDVSLSGSSDLRRFGVARVTSASMPPPTQFEGLFFGDYSGLTVIGSTAYPAWMDTRSLDLFLCSGTGTPTSPPKLCTASASNAARANDQDIFVTSLAVPSR